jgi:hypothetical protein
MDGSKNRAWCYYNNDANNGTTYGKLYNWYAVKGITTAESTTPTTEEIVARKISPKRLAYYSRWGMEHINHF